MSTLEAYLYEPLLEQELAQPFGPVLCASCQQPIREPDGGVWIDGAPWCGPCTRGEP